MLLVKWFFMDLEDEGYMFLGNGGVHLSSSAA
jgi:hypothetical protein